MKFTTILLGAGILTLLAAILIPTIPYCGPSWQTSLTKAQMNEVSTALQLYCVEYGSFPADLDSAKIIKALDKDNPRKLCFYTPAEEVSKSGELMDGWKRPVIFKKTAEGLLMRSAGKDGIYYTKDDVTISVPVPEQTKRASA